MNDTAIYKYIDSDDFDLSELAPDIPAGWTTLIEYGYCNDVDWDDGEFQYHDIPDWDNCNKIDSRLLTALTLAGIDYRTESAVHDDDLWVNRGTSNTCAWWSHIIIVPSDSIGAAVEALKSTASPATPSP